MLLSEIASRLNLVLRGDDVDIVRPALIEDASTGSLCLATSAKFERSAVSAGAAAVLTSSNVPSELPSLIADQPRVAYANILALFDRRPRVAKGIHPTASVDPTAVIDPTAAIGPWVFVDSAVRIGSGVEVSAGCYIGAGTVIGDEVILGPGVVLYHGCRLGNRVRIQANAVIGSEGFGYEFDGQRHILIPHIGVVIIEDDVEIGANCAVDRAKTGATVIGAGSKIDNLVHIAHGVVIGPGTLIAGQVGIAGSTKIGSFCVFGGQVGVGDNLTLGSRTVVTAKSGVLNDLPGQDIYMGMPARKGSEMRKILAGLSRLPELIRRVRALEHQRTGPGADSPDPEITLG